MKAPYHPCPDDEVLQEVAAGLAAQELAERTWQHASRCAICGPALKRYVCEFSDDPRPENARILAQLKSSTPEWQRRLVREVAVRKRARWPKFIPVFAGFAAVLVAVLLGPPLFQAYKLNQAKKQIAAAFAERRTNEPRLTSNDYSSYKPFPTVLGPERSVDELPSSLHNALSAAIEHLKEPKADPRWLQIEGRALLWEDTPGSLEKAEKNFEKARAEGLHTPDLEIDLAAAYYARDNKDPRTLDLLEKVVAEPRLTQQERASALFNLALAYEGIHKWDTAVETWEEYLKVDSSGGWADEAKRHLNDGKAKVAPRTGRNYSDPSFFLRQVAERSLRPEDPEQYQQRALIVWLLPAVRDKDAQSQRALNELAAVFSEHRDQWWNDFLAAVKPDEWPGVRALTIAVRENEQGHYALAQESSIEAAGFFAHYRNIPGELRAQFEEVYARRRVLQGADCIARADPLWGRLSTTNYAWLKARVALERADCRNLRGEFSDSDANLELSHDVAEDHAFPIALLQTIGIGAGMKRLRGDCDSSWEEATRGLDVYWRTMHSRGERLFQFYAVMLQCAMEAGSLDLAQSLIQQAIAMRKDPSADIPPDATIDALLHLHLANILLAKKDRGRAAEERRSAIGLLATADERTRKAYLLTADIELAELQLQQGDAGDALNTLTTLEGVVSPNQDQFFAVRFRKVQGDIYQGLDRLQDALESYRSAIAITEKSLSKISNGAERLAWLRATDESYRGVVLVLLKQGKEQQALNSWEWYQSRATLSGLNGGNANGQGMAMDAGMNVPLTVQAAEGTRIIYAVLKQGLQIWVVRGGKIHGKWVPLDRHEFENLSRDFQKECATESSSMSDIEQHATELYSIMVGPVLPEVTGSVVVAIELDRRIYPLPVEALRNPEGWYFGEKFAVVYSPGIALETQLHSTKPITAEESLLLLDATHSPGAGFLPGMEEERKLILETFPHGQGIDTQTASWLQIQPLIAKSAIFHYMGHGVPRGTGTGLMFNNSQPLLAKDFVPGLFRHSQMVVLSACSTDRGKNGLLDTDNLMNALFLSGVPRVVASRWNVDSKNTSALMQTFYLNLRSGKSGPEALFEARREIKAKRPHPYYWASFTIAGRAI